MPAVWALLRPSITEIIPRLTLDGTAKVFVVRLNSSSGADVPRDEKVYSNYSPRDTTVNW